MKKKRKEVCENCGEKFWKKDLIFGPDPYSHDVCGDDTPVWLCDECHYTSCMDI
jgi:hypothetical protein